LARGVERAGANIVGVDGAIVPLILIAMSAGAAFGGIVFGWTGAFVGAGLMIAIAMSASVSFP
jgi:hypothetical protein